MNFNELHNRINLAISDAWKRGMADVDVTDIARIKRFIEAELEHAVVVVNSQKRDGVTPSKQRFEDDK